MSFGRKGLSQAAAGQSMPGSTGFGTAQRGGSVQPAQRIPDTHSAYSAYDHDMSDAELAAKREAFLASERARGASGAQVTAATPLAAPGLTVEQEREFKAVASKMARPRDEKFFWGRPSDRSVALAYVFWFVCGQLSLHRFYCGDKQGAWRQISLFLTSLLLLFVVPSLGMLGLGLWVLWIFADLFMIPGIMKKFQDQHSYDGVFI